MQETFVSGKFTFEIEVPYKLIETGKSDKKPLIVYLHGFNQNIEQFQKLVDEMLSLEAYHLFIQGPYPIYDRKHRKKVEEWGRSWYLYDGEQDQFAQSLELTSEFLEKVIGKIVKQVSVSRVMLFGYSMGGYLAGYFALSRWKKVNDLIVIGARIKTELFEEKRGEYDHLNVLALHGSKDKSVQSAPQKKCCNQLSEWGATVTFKELEERHVLSSLFLNESRKWLQTLGYS